MKTLIILVIVLLLIYFASKEHFYTSGADLRNRSEVSESPQQIMPSADFNAKELDYYMRR
jgi:ABC-type cobalt transport system substrate-binding protein